MLYPVFVFSFNRGEFLKHCLSTLETCAQGSPVIIIDDRSLDADTVASLRVAAETYEVLTPTLCLPNERKTGGLYNSMNFALQLSRDRGYRRVIFLQDDMQMTRSLRRSDYERIEEYFHSNPRAVQLQTCFIRESSRESAKLNYLQDVSGTAIFKRSELSRGKDNFSAVGVFDVERVSRLLGKFSVGEASNSRIARERGIVMGRALYPFMNWLPYPISHRGKRRSFAHASMEFVAGAGFHPITLMSDAEADRFLSRDPSVLPIAERFLFSPTSPRHDVWSTGGGEYNLVARGGWRAAALHTARWLGRGLRSARAIYVAPSARSRPSDV